MKRVLITGASGFIGRHCLTLLNSQGFDVHAVDLNPITDEIPGINWHQIDLLDPPQVSALIEDVHPSHLLHFAWYTAPGKYWTSLENLRWVQASLTLLMDFARHGGQRVVMAGTCAEYDWDFGYCSEEVTPCSPTTLYGISKHALQIMVEAFSKQFGLSAAWGRIFFLFGPYEHPSRFVPTVIRSMLQGEPARTTHGNQIRDFLYVEDVADAFVTLLLSDMSGSVNIASGLPVLLKDIVYQIGEIIERIDLIRLGALTTPKHEPPLLVADTHRLRGELGWEPQYNLNLALDKTISWWANQVHEKSKSR